MEALIAYSPGVRMFVSDAVIGSRRCKIGPAVCERANFMGTTCGSAKTTSGR